MAEVLLSTLADALGGPVVADATFTATATRARAVGDGVVANKTITVPVVQGVPSEPILLDQSGVDWCWRLRVVFPSIGVRIDRTVAVPDVSSVEWADLVDVDPATLLPAESAVPAWTAAVGQVAAILADTAVARDGAVTAQGLSESARDAAVVARGISEIARDGAVVAQGASEDARDQAQVYAANTVELQDTAFTALIADPESATRTQLSATIDAATQNTLAGVAFWGDSLTEAASVDWVTNVTEAIIGIDTFNGGKSGWASSDIALRAGGLDLAVTVTGNQIPASGAVTVTAISPTSSFRQDGSGAISWVGTLCGVPGTLSHNMTAATWSFTRTTSGAAVACPAESLFLSTQFTEYRRWVNVMMSGRNNFTPGCVLSDVLRDYLVTARRVKGGKFVAVGILASAHWTERFGGTLRAELEELWRMLNDAFGDYYLDLNTPMVTLGMALAGIASTTQDLVDIERGVMPRSLRGASGTDDVHPNADGYEALGKIVANFLVRRGLGAPAALSAPPLAAPSGLAAGASTATTQALSWNAQAGADGYQIERRVGSDAWRIAAIAPSASVIITELTGGTDHEYAVRAVNVAGLSPQSVTVTATTSGSAPVVLASDSFSGSNVSNIQGRSTDSALGGSALTWSTTGGSCAIIDNELGRLDTSFSRSCLLNPAVTDSRVSFKLTTLPPSGQLYLVARYADSSNHYRLVVGATGTLQLAKYVAGSLTSLASIAVAGTVVAGDTVDLSAQGTSIKALVNGVVMLSVTDTAHATGTQVGINLNSDTIHRVDDAIIYDK